MTNDVKDNLFVLVKSLTKSEKRQFKLFVGRMDSNEDSKFLNLFNQLEKMDKYDDKIILEKGIVSKQQLSNLKAHLYKQILISLRLNPVHKNIRLKIRSQIDFATILYQKGLYKQSLKALEKAKNIAYKYDEKTSAYEIVEFEKLIESQYITRSMSNRTKELTTQSDYLRKQNDISSRLSNISLQLYEKLIKVGYVKSDEDYRVLTKFFYSRMPKIKIENLGFREELLYYKAWVWYSLITQDFLSSYKYASKWVNMFERNPEMINIHPVFYLKGTNYLLEALALIKYPVKFKKTLIRLINNIESNNFYKNQNTSSLSFLYKYNNLFNLYALEGNFEESLNVIPDVLDGIDENKDLIDPTHIMLLYYKIGCMYFALDDYDALLNRHFFGRELMYKEPLIYQLVQESENMKYWDDWNGGLLNSGEWFFSLMKHLRIDKTVEPGTSLVYKYHGIVNFLFFILMIIIIYYLGRVVVGFILPLKIIELKCKKERKKMKRRRK